MTWKLYWALWALGTFASFLIPELIAVFTNPKNTLSWTVWDLEGGNPGDPIGAWTTAHVLLGGALLVVLVWLIGHLVFGIWRIWH
jgi:hypothetical protein